MIVSLKDLTIQPEHSAVLVTGGFDPLHYGHIRYFERAFQISSQPEPELWVVVGVAPDSYVTRKHPLLQTLEHRMEMIDAIRWVNFVAPQEEETAASIIRALRPAIFLKGDDWKARTLPTAERDALLAVGAQVEYIPVNPVSSSDLLQDVFWRMADQMGRH